MSSFSVPDVLSFGTLSRNIADLKLRANTTRSEAVTGRYEDITKRLDGDVGSAHLLKKAIGDVQFFHQSLSLAEGRTQTTQSMLNHVSVESNRISTEALAALGRADSDAVDIIAADARVAVSDLFNVLNTTFGGRALFGGDVTDRAPLTSPDQILTDVETIIAGAANAADAEAQLNIYFDNPTGGFATSIYQGGVDRSPPIEIGPGIRIDASAKADDQPIKDIIRSLTTIAASSVAAYSDANTTIETNAKRGLGADAELTELRAVIGVGESRISAAKVRYEAEESVLTSLYNAKTARDPFEAASELQLLETQLEASYLLTSRLSRLTIANFLR